MTPSELRAKFLAAVLAKLYPAEKPLPLPGAPDKDTIEKKKEEDGRTNNS